MQTGAYIVHLTKTRMRVRIPGRRKDISYFLDLYEALRQIDGVTDIEINPSTASVLLHYSGETTRAVVDSLMRIGLLPKEEKPRSPLPVLGPIELFFNEHQSAATDARTVLLTFMIGIAIHQALRGKILVPVLSALWYGYDLLAAHRREKEVFKTTTETAHIQRVR